MVTRRRIKRIVFMIGLCAVAAVVLIQFYPLLQGEKITLFPFGREISLVREDEVESQLNEERNPSVLGTIAGAGDSYSSYAAGFSGVTAATVGEVNTIGDYFVLGGLGQGAVMGNMSKGVAGYGASYISIYNPDPTYRATVRITFYQTAGELLYSQPISSNAIFIPPEDGIVEVLHIRLRDACQRTRGCNVGKVGGETPWAGFARVELIGLFPEDPFPPDFIGIFGVSQSISADGEYSFGHDEFLPGRDVIASPAIILQDIGAGEITSSFGLRDTIINVGTLSGYEIGDPSNAIVRFEFLKYSGSCTTCRTSYNAPLSTLNGTSAFASTLLNLPEGKSWRGWARVYIKNVSGNQRYTTIVTADTVNANQDVGWGQNGLEYQYYKESQLYVGPVAHNYFNTDRSEIVLTNPTAQVVNVEISTNCHSASGPGEVWAPIRGYYEYGILSSKIALPAHSQKTVLTDQMIDTKTAGGVELCSELPLFVEGGSSKAFALNFKVSSLGGEVFMAMSRDVLTTRIGGYTAYSGRAHRFSSPTADVANTVYLPGVYADDIGLMLPEDPYDNSTPNMSATGWLAFNIGFNDKTVDLTQYDVVGNNPVSSGTITVGPAELDTFSPTSNGVIVSTDSAPFVGGFVKFSKSPASPGRLLANPNQAGKGFWRSSPWSTNLSSDVYSSSAVTSQVPRPEGYPPSPPGPPDFYHPFFSSYVYGSDGAEADHDFGYGSGSCEDFEMYGYSFSADADVYDSMMGALESAPTTLACQSSLSSAFASITEDGVYEIPVNATNAVLNLSPPVLQPGSSRIVFIKNCTGLNLSLSIAPFAAESGLYSQSVRQQLLLIVNGDIVLSPSINAVGEDGGDYYDLGIVATGTVTVRSDNTDSPGVNYWQKDPVLVDGLLFADDGVVNQRDLGGAKNSLYPSLTVRWSPVLLVALSEYFDMNSTSFDIPGVW